jgi:hypothetical protein
MKIRSKKALLYDARLQKSGIIVTKLISSYSSTDGSINASFQDFTEVAVTMPEGGSTSTEQPIGQGILPMEVFTETEVETQNDKLTAEQLASLSVKERNETILCMAYLERYKAAKLYGGLATDYEIVP